ncbi:LysR family transcriptional regulator [Sphingomonas elodea]|uniref:LysR family transcriptional regulator n=1 Tax=Sphingomonas elodea TaxID=179878 RepID=UPI00026301C2|nr:LysR family transcriptional regulator [Sphingomonas elodea]
MALQIDPRALITFGAVCQEGSISAAARALNISQPSVSATIAQLEHRIGARLFQRGRGGIVLTSEGLALQRRASALDALLDGAMKDLDAVRQGIVGPLRVGGTPGALVSLLPPAVEKLEHRFGGFALNVVERPDRELTEMLRKGEIELAFVTTEIETPPADIEEITLARDPFALIVGRRHRTLPSSISLRKLADLRWVLPEAQGAFQRQVAAMFVAAEVPEPCDALRSDSLLLTKSIVRSTSRVTILPRQVAAAELSIGVLRAIQIEEARFERSIGVRMLTRAHHSPLATGLLEALKA